MNLSPQWEDFLKSKNIEATHWSNVGEGDAQDSEIMEYAKANRMIVFTHDLDFGAILASTNADAPSVIQIRTHDIMPDAAGDRFLKVLREFQHMIKKGALITIDEINSRIRILPIHS